MENCTIVSNYAKSGGGGVAVSSYGSPTYVGVGVRNTIVYDNWSDAAGDVSNVTSWVNHLMWTNNCVGTAINLNGTGAGNLLQVAPKFVNPAVDDWHLRQGSPCVDKGDTLDWMWTAKDKDGARRIRNGVVDMGCFESAYSLGTVILVQ